MGKVGQGKLIVLEGIDGSGKSTQHKLLVRFLKKQGIKVKTIKFPRHGKPFFGKMIDEYLAGAFGQATKLDGKLASILFALDRLEVKDKIINWLKQGYYFIPDRYLPSNLGHQLGKIIDKPDPVKEDFILWDETMEYKVLGIPRPNLVIYLRVDFDVVVDLLEKRGSGDQHETDHEYLRNSQKAYEFVAKRKKWRIVDCTEGGAMLPPEVIHEKIKKLIKL